VSDGSGWALRYLIACYDEYGARFDQSVEITIPIASRNYDIALMIAEVILREHVAPRLPEPEAHPLDPAGTPDWAAYDSWEESGVKSSPPVKMASRSECCGNM
jgi:hypothetical protein